MMFALKKKREKNKIFFLFIAVNETASSCVNVCVSPLCSDVDECENELQCPGQKCVNSVGSFKCVSCKPGFEIINGQCQGN